MSDDNKKSLWDKIGTVVAIVVGLFAGARLINQGEAAKKLPRLWRSIRGIAELNALRFEDMATGVKSFAYRWLMKLSSFIRWLAFIAIVLVIGGISVKVNLHSSVGHVLVAVGTITFAVLGLLLYVLSDGIATIAYKGLTTFGSMFGKAASKLGATVPETMTEKGLKELRGSVRQVMTVTAVMAFTLLFTMFFPAWSTLGWTVVFWAIAAVLLCIAVAAEMPMGKSLVVLFYATVVLLGVASLIFIIDTLSGGALHFAGFQQWFRDINHSELLVILFILAIPIALIGMSVMSKDKDRRAALYYAAKFAFIGGLLLVCALLYKGTISWNQLWGKDPPVVVTKTVDKAEGAYLKALGDGDAGMSQLPPQAAGSGGPVFLDPPPVGSIEPPTVPATTPTSPRTRPPRLRNQPLPPLEEIEYKGANSAAEDLETIE